MGLCRYLFIYKRLGGGRKTGGNVGSTMFTSYTRGLPWETGSIPPGPHTAASARCCRHGDILQRERERDAERGKGKEKERDKER